VAFWRHAVDRAKTQYPQLKPEQFQVTVVRALIDWQVGDLLENTRQRLRHERIGSVADVRAARTLLVGPGPEVRHLKAELERFLHAQVYQHYRVMRMAHKGRRLLHEMFAEFCRCPALLPARYQRRAQESSLQQTVCDYLAGMTDRYAQDEYLRLFQPYTRV
jgi:dGTPase